MGYFKKTRIIRIKRRFYFFLIVVVFALVYAVYSALNTASGSTEIFFWGNIGNNAAKKYAYSVEISSGSIHQGDLILINNGNSFVSSGSEALVSVFDHKIDEYCVKDNEVQVDIRLIEAFNSMMSDFYEHTGLQDVMVISGYRDYSKQEVLYNAQKQLDSPEEVGTVALPGHSEHETGMALDLGMYGNGRFFDGEGDYGWIAGNCYKYGLIVRYPVDKIDITDIDYEPWHLRYIGVPHSLIMADKNLCLEEYIEFLKSYTYSGTHLAYEDYEIYYVPSDGDTTEVPVPEDREYTISGNNQDGFIITAKQ